MTKIVATIGPSSQDPEVLTHLVQAGVDVFRLNFSHGDQDTHIQSIEAIRKIEKTNGHPLAIMADLQGPKFRIGTFANDKIELTAGHSFRLDSDKTPGDNTRVHLPHPEVIKAMSVGDDLLLDDGNVHLRITATDNDALQSEVISGRTLSNHKGLNAPGVAIPISPLTKKDRDDLALAVEQKVDWLALSFVQHPDDLKEARRLIGGSPVKLLAKIEKQSALMNLEELIKLCDGMMVARGDMGVESPIDEVPIQQRRILSVCRHAGKPVIVATQMLESMRENPTPTRAEVSDVATAVYDGADAVMLSAESASGHYPVQAVTVMAGIISKVENDQHYQPDDGGIHQPLEMSRSYQHTDAVVYAVSQAAKGLKSPMILSFTASGYTATRLSRERPKTPIIAVTDSIIVARQMMMNWGVRPFVPKEKIENFADLVDRAQDIGTGFGLVVPGDHMIITAGVPFREPGITNIMRILTITS
ncbi:MAG: pyruvate kinase [Pseudomonadota bacterium]